MFDVGFAELFLLALIGLLVLGPERLPRAARTVGGLLRRARSSWFALRESIESELAAADLAEPVKSAGKELEKVASQLGEISADPATGTGSSDPAEPTREPRGEHTR